MQCYLSVIVYDEQLRNNDYTLHSIPPVEHLTATLPLLTLSLCVWHGEAQLLDQPQGPNDTTGTVHKT